MHENKIIHRLLEIFEYKREYQLAHSHILPQDMYVLERIYFNKKISMKDISKKYRIPPSTLTGVVDRLENKNLIHRFRSSSDRRTTELAPTKIGIAILETHLHEDEVFSKNLFHALEKPKREMLKSLLQELLEKVDEDNLFIERE